MSDACYVNQFCANNGAQSQNGRGLWGEGRQGINRANPRVPHLSVQRHLLVIQVLFTFSHACPGGRSNQLCQGVEEGLSMRKHKQLC